MGTVLYYMRAVDGTMLTTLSALATEQAKPTTTKMKNMTHQKVLTYKASNMVLMVHSNTSYLNEPKARSKVKDISSSQHKTLYPQTMTQSTTQHKL